MLYRSMRAGNQFRQYTDTLVPLIVESVIVSLLINLVSDYIGTMINMNKTTVYVLLFLLFAVLLLYVLFRGHIRDGNPDYQKPTEFGSLLSLVFFIQIMFFDCSQAAGLGKWFLLGAGILPFFLGSGLSGMLEAKKLAHSFKVTEPPRTPVQPEPEPEPQAEKPAQEEAEETEADGPRRISVRSILDGTLDIESQPGVLIVIIEAILSVKDSVTQLEIFEACRRLSHKLPTAYFIELIRDLMASFVNVRQSTRKVELITENPEDWKITEFNLIWLKRDPKL